MKRLWQDPYYLLKAPCDMKSPFASPKMRRETSPTLNDGKYRPGEWGRRSPLRRFVCCGFLQSLPSRNVEIAQIASSLIQSLYSNQLSNDGRSRSGNTGGTLHGFRPTCDGSSWSGQINLLPWVTSGMSVHLKGAEDSLTILAHSSLQPSVGQCILSTSILLSQTLHIHAP